MLEALDAPLLARIDMCSTGLVQCSCTKSLQEDVRSAVLQTVTRKLTKYSNMEATGK